MFGKLSRGCQAVLRCTLFSLLIFTSSVSLSQDSTLNETEITKRIATEWRDLGVEWYVEVPLWDGSRVDLYSTQAGIAAEVDWAEKWQQSIGQALYYATVTEKKPMVVLIVKTKDDHRFVYRAQTVCSKYDIALKVIDYDKVANLAP